MRWLFALFCLSFVSVSQASFVTTRDAVEHPADRKNPGAQIGASTAVDRRRQPIKTYRISLGKGAKKGPKLIEGDKRTPEGFYWIDWRKVSEKFNLAMHISYPNISDSARARREASSLAG
jgi:hypothetical protein